MDLDLHILLAAIATATSIHRMTEPMNIMQKLQRLDGAIKTGKIAEPMMKGIDTRAKAYGLGVGMTAVMSVIAYLIIDAIDPSVDGAIQYSIAVVVVAELVSMMLIDKYHVEIEKVTQRVGKNKKKKK